MRKNGERFILASLTNKAGSYSNDASLDLVKSLSREYGISEADAVTIYAKESTFGSDPKVTSNVLQLSPSDLENWKETQKQIKLDPSKAIEHYIRGGLRRYREGLDIYDGDFYKAMKYYHSRSEKQNTDYANEAQKLKRDILASGIAEDKGFIPSFGGSKLTEAVRNVVTKDLGAETTYEYLKRVMKEELASETFSY